MKIQSKIQVILINPKTGEFDRSIPSDSLMAAKQVAGQWFANGYSAINICDFGVTLRFQKRNDGSIVCESNELPLMTP